MNDLKRFIHSNEEQATTLLNGGTVTTESGEEIKFAQSDMIIVPDEWYRHTVTTTYPYDGGTATLTFEAINNNPKVFSADNKFPLTPTGSDILNYVPLMFNGEYMVLAVGEGNDRTVRWWLTANFTATVEKYNP